MRERHGGYNGLFDYTPNQNVHFPYYGGTNQKWIFERRRTQPHSGTVRFGISSDNYADGSIEISPGVYQDINQRCSHGHRVSYQAAETFKDSLGASSVAPLITLFDYRNTNSNKDDMRSKSLFSISRNNIDDVNFMTFIGHGKSDTGLHYSNNSTTGISHLSQGVGNHIHPDLNFSQSVAKFGLGANAKTNWVFAYTCNFLTRTTYRKTMMQGVNMVLGFSSYTYVVRNYTAELGSRLGMGQVIYDAYLSSGNTLDCHAVTATYEISSQIQLLLIPYLHFTIFL